MVNLPSPFDDGETIANKCRCVLTLEAQRERVEHFKNRMLELGRTPQDAVILLANVDTEVGRILADALLPGHDWNQYRLLGQIPFARGLTDRAGMQEFLNHVDRDAADELLLIRDQVAIVVVDYHTIRVFPYSKFQHMEARYG